MKISVSILKEKDNINEAINKVNDSICDYLHLDIMDNTFTDNYSFDINDFLDKKIIKKLDVHLMSTNLDKLINDYAKLSPNIITFHYEVGNTLNYINTIKNKNIKVGLAINPNTSLKEIETFLPLINYLLIMSVIPGKGGQEFIKDVLPKIKEAKLLKNKYNYLIGVDGGINSETIKYVKNYADIVVSGSFITSSNDYNKKIRELI